MRSPITYLQLIRHMGAGWIAYRAVYAWQKRSGALKRKAPLREWKELPVSRLELGEVPAPEILSAWGRSCVSEGERVLSGTFRLFSHRDVKAGFVPDWHRNQLTGQRAPADRHWSELGDFAFGDIKGVWELSRFPWAMTLARAFARTRRPEFRDAFWRLFDDWLAQNPPNRGANWMCGQEATFRLIAAVFAAERFGVPAERHDAFARFVLATGQRIAANLTYALSQKNNHGISEAVGLITAALLLPGWPEAEVWRERGMRALQAQLAELVYDDGGFAQHSLIYHRVLLHDLCWCRVRLERVEREVPAWLDAGALRALDFLREITDPSSGRAPLFGSNDGANILPLAEAEFLDMRPVVQLASAVFKRELPLPPGPWDEAVAWLGGNVTDLRRVEWPAPKPRWVARTSGCAQWAAGNQRLFLRCPEKFRHRPSQADMLHVDVSCDGRAVVQDGGSYSYNSRERFATFATAASHNVLTIVGREPLEKFGRFLYLPWPRGTISETAEALSASHAGYAAAGVAWTRTVSPRAGGGFVVADRVSGAAGQTLRWHWRLADAPWHLDAANRRVTVAEGGFRYAVSWKGPVHSARMVRADETTALGWWSPWYGTAEPACALVIDLAGSDHLEMVTEFFSGG